MPRENSARNCCRADGRDPRDLAGAGRASRPRDGARRSEAPIFVLRPPPHCGNGVNFNSCFRSPSQRNAPFASNRGYVWCATMTTRLVKFVAGFASTAIRGSEFSSLSRQADEKRKLEEIGGSGQATTPIESRLTSKRTQEFSSKCDPNKVSGPIVRVAKGAIGNLTINGMRDRAGKLFELFAHAGSREFPGEVEGRRPSQVENAQKAERLDHPDGVGFAVASRV